MAGKHAAPGPSWRERRAARKVDRARGVDDDIPTWDALIPDVQHATERDFEGTIVLDRAELAATLAEESEPASPRRRRIALWASGGVAVVGMAITATIVWVSVGAGVVAPESDHKVTAQIRDDWAAGKGADYIGIIRIPRFGKKWEFSIARGTTPDVLAHGTGWDPDGAKPGQIGNVVVSAHRVTHNAPFHDFPTLRRGDLIEIETRTRLYTYKLMDSGDAISVPDTTLWPLWDVPDPHSRNEKPTDRLLTLITCAKLFHTDKRLIARAEWLSSERKPTEA